MLILSLAMNEAQYSFLTGIFLPSILCVIIYSHIMSKQCSSKRTIYLQQDDWLVWQTYDCMRQSGEELDETEDMRDDPYVSHAIVLHTATAPAPLCTPRLMWHQCIQNDTIAVHYSQNPASLLCIH